MKPLKCQILEKSTFHNRYCSRCSRATYNDILLCAASSPHSIWHIDDMQMQTIFNQIRFIIPGLSCMATGLHPQPTYYTLHHAHAHSTWKWKLFANFRDTFSHIMSWVLRRFFFPLLCRRKTKTKNNVPDENEIWHVQRLLDMESVCVVIVTQKTNKNIFSLKSVEPVNVTHNIGNDMAECCSSSKYANRIFKNFRREIKCYLYDDWICVLRHVQPRAMATLWEWRASQHSRDSYILTCSQLHECN